jgi:hypothetical protein
VGIVLADRTNAGRDRATQWPSDLARCERHGQREGVGVVVVTTGRVIHDGLATDSWPALQELQLPGQLRMIEKLDPALREEWLGFEIRAALV